MIRDLQTMLAYESKRRPELAAIMQQVGGLTDAEIHQLPVALPWMRRALVELKHKHEFAALAASADEWAVDGLTADPMGVARRWVGADAYVKVGRTQLLVTTGSLFWLDCSGIWFDTIFTTEIDPKLKANSVSAGRMTRSDYIKALRARRGDAVPSAEPLDKPLFKIFRIE